MQGRSTRQRYVGLTFDGTRYAAGLKVGWDFHNLGRWDTAREAAIARDRAILYFGLTDPLAVPGVSRNLGPLSPEDLRRAVSAKRRRTNGTSSRFIGVFRSGTGWATTIGVDYRSYHIHGFTNEEEAAVARDRLAHFYRGNKARLNFPERELAPATLEEIRASLPPRPHGARSKRVPAPCGPTEPRCAVPPQSSPSKRTARDARAVAARGKRSRFNGVYYVPQAQAHPWVAVIQHPTAGKSVYLGAWATQAEAARAYDRARLAYYGRGSGRLNFPAHAHELVPAEAPALIAETFERLKRSCSSRFRGVYWGRGAWNASITDKRERSGTRYIGRFLTEEEAAMAWDREATKQWGTRAKLNFDPRTHEELGGRLRYQEVERRRASCERSR